MSNGVDFFGGCNPNFGSLSRPDRTIKHRIYTNGANDRDTYVERAVKFGEDGDVDRLSQTFRDGDRSITYARHYDNENYGNYGNIHNQNDGWFNGNSPQLGNLTGRQNYLDNMFDQYGFGNSGDFSGGNQSANNETPGWQRWLGSIAGGIIGALGGSMGYDGGNGFFANNYSMSTTPVKYGCTAMYAQTVQMQPTMMNYMW